MSPLPLRYGITKTFEVPLKYAYQWCTDFRDDDNKLVNGPYPRHILRRKKGEYVWVTRYDRDGKVREGVRLVTLRPPNAWHNEAINEEKESILDYRLDPLGKSRTKLTIRVKVSYKTMERETREELEKGLSALWDKYGAALEADYRSGKSPLA